jgi:flagellar hook-basal body complex protein FliE
MAIPPINPIKAVAANPTIAPANAPGATEKSNFGGTIKNALESVSAAEFQADAVATDIATGGNSGVHELMTAMAKAELGVELLVQVRNRALEAYQEVMRMQV